MRRTMLLAGMLAIVPGCGPHAGSVIELKRSAVLYVDKGLYRQAAEAPDRSVTSVTSYVAGHWCLLDKTSEVRVLSSDRHGYKVEVESAMERDEDAPIAVGPRYKSDPSKNGKIGWILSSAL